MYSFYFFSDKESVIKGLLSSFPSILYKLRSKYSNAVYYYLIVVVIPLLGRIVEKKRTFPIITSDFSLFNSVRHGFHDAKDGELTHTLIISKHASPIYRLYLHIGQLKWKNKKKTNLVEICAKFKTKKFNLKKGKKNKQIVLSYHEIFHSTLNLGITS